MEAIAEAVRRACLDAAMRAHEDAGIRGVCAEGRWEAAVCAIRELDLRSVAEHRQEASCVDLDFGDDLRHFNR